MHRFQRHPRDLRTPLLADLDGFAGRAFTHALASSDSMAGVRTCGTTRKPSRNVGIKSEGDSRTGRRVKSD